MNPLQPPRRPPSPLLPIPIPIPPPPPHRLREIPSAPPAHPIIQRLQIIIQPKPMRLCLGLQREALSIFDPSVIAVAAVPAALLQLLAGAVDAGPEAGAEEGVVEEGAAGEEAGGEEVDARLDACPEGELDGSPGAVVEGGGAEELDEADDGGDEAAVCALLVSRK